MKLYVFPFAPNPRKVIVYLKEKGLDVELVHVDLPGGEHRREPFLTKNPMGALPVLELDDGSLLTESLAIIEYLEELQPEPPMIGTSPLERARVRELERFVEMSFLGRVGRVFRNTHPLFAAEHKPQLAVEARAELPKILDLIDRTIGKSSFAAGSRPTIADCTLFAAFELGRAVDIDMTSKWPNVARWHAQFSARPSAELPQ